MTQSKRTIGSQKLVSQLELARILVRRCESRLDGARAQARLAKQRRKEAKQAARRARKEVKRAKAELAEAEQALAEAEVRLAQAGRRAIRLTKGAKAPGKSRASAAGPKRRKRPAPPSSNQPVFGSETAVAEPAGLTEQVPSETGPPPSAPVVVERPTDS
jgi:multidrug efflux pump subunit AcrA (membrane-fusion protein)